MGAFSLIVVINLLNRLFVFVFFVHYNLRIKINTESFETMSAQEAPRKMISQFHRVQERLDGPD